MRRYKKKNNERRNQIILSIVLAFIMVSSIVGFVVNSSGNYSNSYSYNGHKFTIDVENNVLLTKVNGKEYYFYNYPDTVTPIPQEAISTILSANQPGPYLTFDPRANSQDLQVIDLVRSELDDFFSQRNTFISAGVYPEKLAPYNSFPVLDCVNATEGSPVIKFINSSVTYVNYENYCLELEGTSFGLVELRDSLLYSFLGII